MGEQTGTRLNHRSAICKFPSELKRKKPLRRRRNIIMAMSLAFIFTTTGLVYYLMLPPLPPPYISPEPIVTTPHAPIEIEGDANFSATALLEGWPGDGSPESPYIIDGLGIDLGGGIYSWDGGEHCILIKDTRVSFTISNCNITGARVVYLGSKTAGIYLENVTNGELVNNILDNNNAGISLSGDSNTVANNICSNNGGGIGLSGDSNTVANNICSNNTHDGISLDGSDYNTVANNICNSNGAGGISLWGSHSNTVAKNTCNYNNGNYIPHGGNSGIRVYKSYSNTVSENTCNYNRFGIYLRYSYPNTTVLVNNTLVNNICFGNLVEGIIEDVYGFDVELQIAVDRLSLGVVVYIGFMVIILLGGMWIVHKRVSKEGN